MRIKFTRRRHERADIIQRFTADAEQREPALNQTLPGVYMSFSPVFNTPPTLPIKPRGPSVSAFTAASPGRWVGEGLARGRGRGITRHGEARYERAYGRSYEGQFAFHGGPGIPQGIWRNLRGGGVGGEAGQ